jgi:hypothetical protein
MRYSGPAAHLVDAALNKFDPPTVGGYVAYREKPDDVYDARDYEPYVYTVFPRLHPWHANTGFEIAGVTLHGERQPGISESVVCNNVANIFNTGGFVITAGDDVYAIPRADDFKLPMSVANLANIENAYAGWLVVPPDYVRRAMSTAIHGGTATLVSGAKMAEILELWHGRVLPPFNIDHFLASWRVHVPAWEPLFNAIQILWQAEFDAFNQAPLKASWVAARLIRSLRGFANNPLFPHLPIVEGVLAFVGGSAILEVPPRVAFGGGAAPPAVAVNAAAAAAAVAAVALDIPAVDRVPHLATVINHDDTANFRASAAAMFAGGAVANMDQLTNLMTAAVFGRCSDREYSNLHRNGAATSLADYHGVFGRYVVVALEAARFLGFNRPDLTAREMTSLATTVILLMLASALGRPFCELPPATMRAILYHYYVGRAVTGAVPGGMFQVNLMA